MNLLCRQESCPYCGEVIELLVDESDRGQTYTEDCQVCCRPILISVSSGFESDQLIALHREDE
jgi:hypothetical protein